MKGNLILVYESLAVPDDKLGSFFATDGRKRGSISPMSVIVQVRAQQRDQREFSQQREGRTGDKDRECPECHYEFSFGSEGNWKEIG